MASDQCLHYLQLVQQILDTLAGSEMEFFKFLDKYGKELKCQNSFMGSTVYYGIVLKWACIYWYQCWQYHTKCWVKISADNILKYFSQKIGFGILCKLSPKIVTILDIFDLHLTDASYQGSVKPNFFRSQTKIQKLGPIGNSQMPKKSAPYWPNTKEIFYDSVRYLGYSQILNF